MPHFFFDTHSNYSSSRDTVGAELASAEMARQELMRALSEIVSDELSVNIDRYDFAADIRDDVGRVIFSANLSVHAKWVD